jgi:CRISPR-associated endonuclease/helicase Cas3
MSIYCYWGKARPVELGGAAYHLLAYHSLDVAAVGKTLLDLDDKMRERLTRNTGLDENAVATLVTFFLALHDLGKFAEGFQNLRPDVFKTLRGRDSKKDYTVRHDSLGDLLWRGAVWPGGWKEGWLQLGDRGFADMYDWQDIFGAWIRSVTGHHGTPPRESFHGVPLSLDNHFDAESRLSAISFVKDVANLFLGPGFSPLVFEDELERASKQLSWTLSGLAVLSDWIGSDSARFPYQPAEMPLAEYWTVYALPQALAAVKASGVIPPLASSNTGMKALFPQIREPSPLQEHVSACEIARSPQLFILEDTTGSGKTEAAVTLAHRMMAEGLGEGIFMALPTMATANAMYERLEGAYQRMYSGSDLPSLVLAHSGRHLSSSFQESIGLERQIRDPAYARGDETASVYCAAWLADSRKKALLAAVGVGTVDQALLAVLPVRHQSLRLLGLSRSVLIVDEVHAYDPYMHALLRSLLRFHSAQGGSAILLSATLPCRTRQELGNSFIQGLGGSSKHVSAIGYPLVTHVSGSSVTEIETGSREGIERTVTVEFVDNEASVERRILENARDGRCACWVRNTVDDAVRAYRRLSNELGEGQALLFHARYAMGDRLAIEADVLRLFGKDSKPENRAGKILVATQVVEQSLDLDFDFMASDLAPVDLMIQRAGRLHRHQRGDRGKAILLVLAPCLIEKPGRNWYADLFPRGAFVYPSHGQLWLTARLLADMGEFRMPDDARKLVESVFGDEEQDQIPKGLLARDRDADGKARAATSLAQLNALDLDAGYASTLNQWLEDTVTPTRLGDPTVTVRLGRWDGSDITPWFAAARHAWDLSQVSIRKALISETATNVPALENAVDIATKAMPDEGRWSVFVPLRPVGDGTWIGRASNGRTEVVVAYDSRTGLQVAPLDEKGAVL